MKTATVGEIQKNFARVLKEIKRFFDWTYVTAQSIAKTSIKGVATRREIYTYIGGAKK